MHNGSSSTFAHGEGKFHGGKNQNALLIFLLKWKSASQNENGPCSHGLIR